jgi:hypothetical protein
MKSWWQWLLLALFLTAITIIQFIPDGSDDGRHPELPGASGPAPVVED